MNSMQCELILEWNVVIDVLCIIIRNLCLYQLRLKIQRIRHKNYWEKIKKTWKVGLADFALTLKPQRENVLLWKMHEITRLVKDEWTFSDNCSRRYSECCPMILDDVREIIMALRWMTKIWSESQELNQIVNAKALLSWQWGSHHLIARSERTFRYVQLQIRCLFWMLKLMKLIFRECLHGRRLRVWQFLLDNE
jgi:hypothetical protein